jgi:hypothetical protein
MLLNGNARSFRKSRQIRTVSLVSHGALHHHAINIHSVNLKNRLRDIETDQCLRANAGAQTSSAIMR